MAGLSERPAQRRESGLRRHEIRIAIFGVGALGCLVGARLSPHADVTLIGHWPEQLTALQSGPLQIILLDGGIESINLKATDSPVLVDQVDTALILTKASKTEPAAAQAAGILKPDGVVITLQNGLGNLERISPYVPDNRVTLGITMMGAAMERPGLLRLGGHGRTVLAARDGIDSQVRAVATLFKRAGLPCEVSSDIAPLVWGKLAVNAAINPLTAVLRVKNGALIESAWSLELMRQAALEVAAVAHAKGIALPFPDAAARAEQVARDTAANRSSMLQDMQRGAVTEIETICGAVVREGEKLGVPTPVNSTLLRLVRAAEDLAGKAIR